MKGLLDRVDAALFGGQSATALGAFRAAACGLCFLSLLTLALVFVPFYSEDGLWPRAFQDEWSGGIPRLNLLYFSDSMFWAWLVWGLGLLSSLLASLGLFTRPSLAVLFLCLVTLHHRSPDLLNSGDTLMRQWIFILLISPSGRALSLDAWLATKKGHPPSKEISSWPLRLVQLQLAVVYLTTVWHKAAGELWLNGTAPYITSQLREFGRFPMPAFLDTQPFLGMQGYGTLVVELALGTLVFFRPLRGWVLLAGMGLHSVIEYSMNIPFFAAIICAGYIAHYRGEEVEGFLKWLGARLPFLIRNRKGEKSWPDTSSSRI